MAHQAHLCIVATALSGLLLATLSRSALACYPDPECPASRERAIGIGIGLGTAGMVALLAPLAANDLFAHDASKGPSYGTTAAIAGGTAALTVAVTAIAAAASTSGDGSYVIAGGRTLPEAVFWMGPPLVLGTVAAVVANLVLRVPVARVPVAFAVSPTRSGVAGALGYAF